jgi:hypothetical protein
MHTALWLQAIFSSKWVEISRKGFVKASHEPWSFVNCPRSPANVE